MIVHILWDHANDLPPYLETDKLLGIFSHIHAMVTFSLFASQPDQFCQH